MPGRHSAGSMSDVTWERYRRLRNESRERMGADEITNEEFMCLLLDVYEFHLQTGREHDTKAVLLDG